MRQPDALTCLFERDLPLQDGVYVAATSVAPDYDAHTADVFSDKWSSLEQSMPDEDEGWKRAQWPSGWASRSAIVSNTTG